MFSIRTTTLRRRLALLAAVTAIVGLSTGATMASAQAAPTAETSASAAAAGPGSDSGRRMVASAAPDAARTSALAVSPGVSPPVSTIHVAPGGTYYCPSGVLCTEVWDPTVSAVKVFSFYYCNTYSLSNWNGSGGWINFQTGGAWAYLYDQSGTAIRALRAGYQGTADWAPVWYIRNC